MNENFLVLNDKEEKIKNEVTSKSVLKENGEGEQYQNESQRSSASTLSINQNNNNINFGMKSKLLQEDEDLLNTVVSQRKSSAPASFSENFVLNFIKIGKEVRYSYFNKLMSIGLLGDKTNNKKFNNIFIFDWDDTLLCTTVLSPTGYFDDNMVVLPSKMEKIQKLEILVKKILTLTSEKGDTYIITNSEPGWVEYSCKRFFPDTFDVLNKIKIISARGLYEEKYPKEFRKWKNRAFNEIIKKYDKKLPTNIICMGDSSCEIEAAHEIVKNFPEGFIKAIKFRELPKIEELINQLNLVLDKFNYIYSVCKNLTITVDKRKKKE